MKKAEVKATGEVRINPDIAPTEKVEEYAVTPEAFEVAVQAEIDNAKITKKFEKAVAAVNAKVEKCNAVGNPEVIARLFNEKSWEYDGLSTRLALRTFKEQLEYIKTLKRLTAARKAEKQEIEEIIANCEHEIDICRAVEKNLLALRDMYRVTPEDDGSNDEPEEDFLETLDTSVDEDAEDDELIDEPQAEIAAADSVPTFTTETLARPNRQFFIYGFHTLHFFTTEVTAIIKAEKSLKYHQGRINGLKKRFAQGNIDADNYALDMLEHKLFVDKYAAEILFCEKEIVNNLPTAIAELPELEKFVKHYDYNDTGDYCNMLAAAKFIISYAQNVAAEIDAAEIATAPAVEVAIQAEIDNATVQEKTEMYNSLTNTIQYNLKYI